MVIVIWFKGEESIVAVDFDVGMDITDAQLFNNSVRFERQIVFLFHATKIHKDN